MKELNGTGMVEIYNHQYLWDNRMTQRVYDAFVDIWDMEDLWVSIDRANLNPPKKVKGPNQNGFIHWDSDTSLDPLPIGVQGVLSLVKQDGDIGGFQCIPELFYNFDEWVKTQPADRDPMHPDTTGLKITNIEMEPGDLMIFNTLLAHGVRPNHSDNRVPHGAVHLDVPGRRGQREGTAGAHQYVAQPRASAPRRVPRRSARLGEEERHHRQADAARREAARPAQVARELSDRYRRL